MPNEPIPTAEPPGGTQPDLAGSGTPGGELAAAPAQTGPLGILKGLFGSPDEPAVAETPYPTTSAAEPTLASSPEFPPTSTASITPPVDVGSSALDGVSSTDLKASADKAFTRLAGNPGSFTEAAGTSIEGSEAPDAETAMRLVSDLRRFEGNTPLDVQVSGADRAELIRGYLEFASREGLDNVLDKIPAARKVQAIMAAQVAARSMGKPNAPILSPEEIERVLNEAAAKGIIRAPGQPAQSEPGVQPRVPGPGEAWPPIAPPSGLSTQPISPSAEPAISTPVETVAPTPPAPPSPTPPLAGNPTNT